MHKSISKDFKNKKLINIDTTHLEKHNETLEIE